MFIDIPQDEAQNNVLHYGGVAQLGEHHVRNVGVEGSSPFASTRNNMQVQKWACFFTAAHPAAVFSS